MALILCGFVQSVGARAAAVVLAVEALRQVFLRQFLSTPAEGAGVSTGVEREKRKERPLDFDVGSTAP